jgi:hypothetical protein
MASGDIDNVVRVLDDTRQIINVLNLYGLTIDTQRWELFDQVFMPDVVADYTPPAYFPDREAIRKSMADFHAPLDGSQHTITNHQVIVNGDRASSISYVIVRLVRGDDFFQAGGFYDDTFIRSPAGWRIIKRSYRGNWWRGNPNVGGHPGFAEHFEPKNCTLRKASDADEVSYLKALAK